MSLAALGAAILVIVPAIVLVMAVVVWVEGRKAQQQAQALERWHRIQARRRDTTNP